MNRQIIIFLPSFESGGVERNAVYFANEMVKNNFDIHLMYTRKTNDWFSHLDLHINKVNIRRWIRFPFVHERLLDAINMLFFGIKEIYKIRKKGQTAIISFQSNVIAIILGNICRVPVSARISNHFELVEHENSYIRKFSEFGKRITYGFAKIVYANSSELANDYASLLNREVETIQNPINFERINQLKYKRIDECIFKEKKRPIIISAGRLTPQKNFSLLLYAMVEVLKELPCDLIILGEGSERESLENLIQDIGVSGFVHLLGYKENVYKYFRCSDLFVLSSRYEGMPNVLIEAIATGLPAVSTHCKSGPYEILCAGEGGGIVPIDDYHALAKEILYTLKYPILAKEKHAIASENIKTYDIKIINMKYINMLNKLFSLTE